MDYQTIEQVADYESLVFQSAAKTQEHYEAVCRIMEALKQAKKGMNKAVSCGQTADVHVIDKNMVYKRTKERK
jgi:hypothetical protein